MYYYITLMEINKLIKIIETKISKNILFENIIIEDKSFLHKFHKNNMKGKYHIKISIKSKQLSSQTKIQSSKLIHSILKDEISLHIHSIQILIN